MNAKREDFTMIPDGALEDDTHEFWGGDSCAYLLHEEITQALEDFAPDGYYFGNTEGNSSDYGFWKCAEEDNINKGE